ncbi:hypothetical protein GCM10010168_56400 [Actinoplanes ianthinogenes]|uniref:DNA-binding protein n=1 Tax=Actinoplanes ianthinogenes TaxID=122358 RepID=A0ABM7M2S3_9ACTN|nr:hypothetical protein [Actinoplanes ianthinogenes]BCJ45940.1 hypothetical protein Aiant_65970 [Actinoplanes ianthinogenes]GGR31010.1 hypothetical protein GCM10010168_56400 [Actinoplanes ianthinogenes]
MSDGLLEAGAVLPGPAPDATRDTVTARAYRHPALDGRTVVRLTGATVGPAEDLTMEFLGFATGGAVEVGHGPRQALGFPAWALVHDPAHGRHALVLVQEMERLRRTAGRKPGLALDGYRALAQRLDGAAPQLLPTFWEQAGRAFLAADNARPAGTCFTEARRAERVHGLVVDEERLREVHLEFAFAGALTAAMLTAYAREVADRQPGPEAYELVKTLALRRVAGGLTPHSSMATDLSRLAKAAGLDAGREAEEVVARLLTYPAVSRSHPSVWKAYRKDLVRLGRRDATVRSRLLEIVPDPPGHHPDFTGIWLDLLEETGAAADLVSPELSGVSAGRWLERLLGGRRIRRRDVRLLGLIERMGPRLIAEGGLTVAAQPWSVDLDVLDLCRAMGVPARIGGPHRDDGFDVTAWARDTTPGRRDLAAIAADPELRPRLRQGVRQAIRQLRDGSSLTSPALPARTLREALGAAGAREVLVELIGELTAQAADSTVTELEAGLSELAALWSPAGMELAPDGFGRLAAVDMPAVLARTLRAGLPAELAWPAYERATARLAVVKAGDSWPALVVHDAQRAQVVGPDGTISEHVFRTPAVAHHSYVTCVLVDDQLLVSWQSVVDGVRAYWSAQPDEVFEGELRIGRGLWSVPAAPLPLPRGGLTTGARPLHAGDLRLPPETLPLAWDGVAYWRCELVEGADGNGEWRWREFDPRTGDGGRFSVPAFFAAAGDRLVPEACQWRPVPAEFADSPLGVRDGMTGWRTVTDSENGQAGEGIDGRRVTVARRALARGRTGAGEETLVAAVLLPGAAAPLPVTRVRDYRHESLRWWTADGEHLLADQPDTTATLPPLAWWHAMRARDEAGSAALRALDETTAAALLAVDDAVTGTIALREAVAANLAAHLPAVTAVVLRDRVAEVVTRAIRLRRRIATVPGHLTPPAAPATGPAPAPTVADDALRKAWDGLAGSERTYYSHSAAARHQVLEQVAGVAALLAAPDTTDPAGLPAVGATWPGLLGGLGAVALRAASPVTGAADRAALVAFLGAIAGTPLDGSGPPLRVLEVVEERMEVARVDVHRDAGHLTVLFPPGRYQAAPGAGQWRRGMIQVAPDGVFSLPEGVTVHAEARPTGRLSGTRLTAFLALLAERGPVPWRPAAAEGLAAATGMGRGEAVLLLAGLPGMAAADTPYLTAEQRATLGISAAVATTGRAGLRELSFAERVALLDAAMPADPADLWERGPEVPAVAGKWIALRGRRAAVPDELVAELARVIDASRAAAVLAAIAAPAPGDWLNTDGRTVLVDAWRSRTESDRGEPFEHTYLRDAGTALPWLAYRLPWGDPLRAALPEALRLVRERLRNPDLLIGQGLHEPGRLPDVGPVLVEGPAWQDRVSHFLAPARLSGPDDPALGHIGAPNAVAIRILLSDWMDRAVGTPDGATGDPHDPRVSVPGLVAEVRDRFGLDDAAAAYYLQVLALPDPADKAVLGWNGWRTAALRAAQQALTTAGLVVAAKRARAGRPVFLPGGWQEERAPRLPVETWKQSMYAEAGHVRIVPMSLPELFRTAWGRVVAGDPPRYHDLREKP